MAQPQINVNELKLLVHSEGLKNLDSFSTKKTIFQIKKNLEGLISTDAETAYHYLAILYTYQNDYETAKKYFQKALAISPNNVTLLLNHIQILNMIGKYENSVTYCVKALQLEPLNTLAFEKLNNIGMLYLLPDVVQTSIDLYQGDPINANGIKDKNEALQFINFMNEIQLNIETYRIHLSKVLSVLCHFYNLHQLHTSLDCNYEAGYLSTVIAVPETSAQNIANLNHAMDKAINSWLEAQPDGGFDLADELEKSIIYFSAHVDQGMESHHAPM